MAIDNNQTVRESRVRRGDTVVIIRHGLDDGAFTNAGSVVVEDNGVLRRATANETLNYFAANEDDEKMAALKTRAGAIDVPAPTPLAIKEYLKAKFPGDFA